MLLLTTVILTACGGGAAPESTSATTPNPNNAQSQNATNAATSQPVESILDTSALPTNAAGVPVVARVNDVDILQTEYDRALARSQQLSIAADPRALAQTVLDTLIEQQVIEQAAAKLNITVTDAEIDADISNMSTQAGSTEAWEQWKKDNLYTDDEYRMATRSQLITLRVRDAVLAQMLPTPDSTAGVRQVHARHILVATEAEANDILTQLNNGADFAALAAQYSRDVTTKDRGGDLGFFIRENLTTPELADVAFGLQPGEIAGPVATSLGYHIIQTIEFGTQPANPEDQAIQQETLFTSWLQQQMAQAKIERFLN